MAKHPADVLDSGNRVRVLRRRCACGCGQETAIAPRTKPDQGWIKGEPMPRIPGHRVPVPIRDKETGCLIWRGRVDDNGYGKRGSAWAHRLAYEASNGPIPPGWDVDHLCRIPLCVEPTHLEAVPPETNQERRVESNRRERCPQDHLLGGANLIQITTRPNERHCRECKKKRDTKRRRALDIPERARPGGEVR